MSVRGHTFGPQLRKYVKHKKIKQRDLARETLISYGQVSKILHGYCNVFIDDVIAILNYLDVSLDFILNEEWHK